MQSVYSVAPADWTYIYKYIYRYHTMTNVYTVALLPTKYSSYDVSGFRHGFGAKASLLQTQSAPSVTPYTTRLCWIVVTLWDCHIHADAVRALSWIFFMHFLLFGGESSGLVKNKEVELVMKPRHLTPIETHWLSSRFWQIVLADSHIFSNLRWCALSKFS